MDERNATEESDQDQLQHVSNTDDAVEDDGAPVLDDIDLEENGLTEEQADDIEWEEPQ